MRIFSHLTVFGLLYLLFSFSSKAQGLLSKSELDKQKTYTTLESAVANKNQVYKLNLSNKKLKEFPKEILLFENLHELNLSKNSIKEIPAEIRNLQKLQVLNLSKNKIKRFPESFGDLKELQTLYMSRNRLIYFPNEMRGLDKLKYLDITHNHLTHDENMFIRKIVPEGCEIVQ